VIEGDKEGADAGERTKNNESLKSLRCFRKEHIKRALIVAGNDGEKAAEALGITVSQLRHWMLRLGIAVDNSSPESGRHET